MKRIKIEWIYLLLLGIITFAIGAWTLNENFYFMFDDIDWLRKAKFDFDVKNFFTFLPTSRYNDRPIRTFLFWCLFQIFELNYTGYYFVVLVWHVMDTYLMYLLAKNVFELIGNTNDEIKNKAFVCAILFGMYPKNLMAVYWLAGAANDLVCGSLSLLCMLAYVYYIKERKSYISVILSLIFYVLAMRSKEAAICLPIIIILFELYLLYKNKEKFRVRIGAVTLLGYMILYLGTYFSLPAGLTTEGQYKTEFSILTIIEVILNYIRMYFGLDDSTFSYTLGSYHTKVGNVGIIICVLVFVYIVYCLLRKRNLEEAIWVLGLILAVGLSLAPLLLLPNIQHLLYFYFPASFLAFFFGEIIYKIFKFVKWRHIFKVAIPGLMILMLMVNNVGGAKQLKEWWLLTGAQALSTVNDIQNIGQLQSNTKVYLYGAAEGANVFNYAPGYIVEILNNDDSIEVILADDITEYEAPYVVWQYYVDGHVIEVERVN